MKYENIFGSEAFIREVFNRFRYNDDTRLTFGPLVGCSETDYEIRKALSLLNENNRSTAFMTLLNWIPWYLKFPAHFTSQKPNMQTDTRLQDRHIYERLESQTFTLYCHVKGTKVNTSSTILPHHGKKEPSDFVVEKLSYCHRKRRVTRFLLSWPGRISLLLKEGKQKYHKKSTGTIYFKSF